MTNKVSLSAHNKSVERNCITFPKEDIMQKYKPGEEAPKTGNYVPYDKNGKTDGQPTHLEKGQRFPATQHSGSYYTEGKER